MFFCGKKPYKSRKQICSVCIFSWSNLPWSQSLPGLAEPWAALKNELGTSSACAASWGLATDSPHLAWLLVVGSIHLPLRVLVTVERTELQTLLLCKVLTLEELLLDATCTGEHPKCN